MIGKKEIKYPRRKQFTISDVDLEFKQHLKEKFPLMFARREKFVTQMGLVGDTKVKITLEIGNRFDLVNSGSRGTRGLVCHR